VTLDEGHYYIYFLLQITIQKSKFMAVEKPGKLGEFFLLLFGHLYYYHYFFDAAS